MAKSKQYKLIGRGVYSLTEASRIAQVPARSLRRWTRGYWYRSRGSRYFSPPVIAASLDPVDGAPVLDFADLIESRFLFVFRKHGVKWKAIRLAAERAKELLGRHHPFSTKMFKTDGRTILADIVGPTGDKRLLDLVRDQWEFSRVVSPYLYAGLEFGELNEPTRWWPLGTDRRVLIDPLRSFGAPIVAPEGVPTRVIANTMEAEDSIDLVASIYDVSVKSVEDAIEYEHDIAA